MASAQSTRRTSKGKGRKGDDSPFLEVRLTATQEDDLDRWIAETGSKTPLAKRLGELLDGGIAVKIGPRDNSFYATLENTDRKEDGLPCLLSGWSDAWEDALLVACYKLSVVLEGNWASPLDSGTRPRRR